jgi:hypothetical protein
MPLLLGTQCMQQLCHLTSFHKQDMHSGHLAPGGVMRSKSNTRLQRSRSESALTQLERKVYQKKICAHTFPAQKQSIFSFFGGAAAYTAFLGVHALYAHSVCYKEIAPYQPAIHDQRKKEKASPRNTSTDPVLIFLLLFPDQLAIKSRTHIHLGSRHRGDMTFLSLGIIPRVHTHTHIHTHTRKVL